MNRRKMLCRILMLSIVSSITVCIPQKIFAQAKKGLELYDSGEYRKAEESFRETLKADPSNVANNFYLGLSLLLQEKFRDATDILLKVKYAQDSASRQARSPVPNEYQIQISLARAQLGLKQYSEAWKHLEAARTEDNSSSDVYVYRGAYYLQQEKYKEALKELERAISLNDQNPYAYYYQGLAYFHSGKAEKAVDALRNFIKLAPSAPEAVEAKSIIDRLC